MAGTNLETIQAAHCKLVFDARLFYDHDHNDPKSGLVFQSLIHTVPHHLPPQTHPLNPSAVGWSRLHT